MDLTTILDLQGLETAEAAAETPSSAASYTC